jgi:hypothetical protein
MPIGRAKPGHNNLPPYLAQEYGRNTNSTGSTDSVRTQVPMPYHLPNEQGYSYDNGSLIDGSPFSTPVLDGSGGFETFGRPTSSSKTLNPHSDPYVPGFSAPSAAHQGLGFEYNGNTYNQGGFEDYQRQQMGGVSQQSEYYPQGNIGMGGPVGGSQLPGTSYAQLPGNAYQHYNNGSSYTYDVGSPAMSYTNPSPIQNYHTQVPYGPATGFGPTPVWNNSAYGNYSAIQPSDQYRGPREHRNSFSSGPRPHFPNMNKKRSVSDFHTHSSNLGTAPVHYGSPKKGNNFHPQNAGGPVQPSPPSARSGSPNKSSTRASSVAPSTSRASANEEPPTPGPHPRQLDLSFKSEPRPNEQRPRSESMVSTPRPLRSVKGQSITGLKSAGHVRADSAGSVGSSVRRDSTDFFTEPTLLDNLKGMSMDEKHTPSKRQAPPKMLSLLAAGGVDASTLSPITEGLRTQLTPYSGNQRGRPAFNDPFGPSPSMLTPFTGKTLLRDEQSYVLKNLTHNNTRKPSVDEALDPKNFPFAEYCRLPKPDKWGVIKIKNVSFHLPQ